jgi:hypothetical protein
MKNTKPVAVSKAAFIFCKTTIALILWAALIFQVKWLIFISFFLLAASALAGIQKAPLILLYTITINKLIPSAAEIIDEYGIRFAQSLGAAFNLLCLLFLYLIHEPTGWVIVLVVALLKTSGALGFCTGLKLYECLFRGCCPIFRSKTDAE